MADRNVVIVAYPGVQSLDVTGPFEVFAGARRAAEAFGTDGGYEVRLVAAAAGPVRNIAASSVITTRSVSAGE